MRFIYIIILGMTADFATKSFVSPEFYAYATVLISFSMAVAMLTSKIENERDFGILLLGIELSKVMTHFEMDTLGKEKVIDQIQKSWVDTNTNVWIALGILGVITYSMRIFFKPKT